jgi:hypothetical protein
MDIRLVRESCQVRLSSELFVRVVMAGLLSYSAY